MHKNTRFWLASQDGLFLRIVNSSSGLRKIKATLCRQAGSTVINNSPRIIWFHRKVYIEQTFLHSMCLISFLCLQRLAVSTWLPHMSCFNDFHITILKWYLTVVTEGGMGLYFTQQGSSKTPCQRISGPQSFFSKMAILKWTFIVKGQLCVLWD